MVLKPPVRLYCGKPYTIVQNPLREKVCPECGISVHEYRMTICAPMVKFLAVLRDVGRPVKKRELRDLPGNVATLGVWNQHWGLATNQANGEKRGPWQLTDRGVRFIAGEIAIPAHCVAVALHRTVVRFEGERVTYREALKMRGKEYEDYAASRRSTVRGVPGSRS